MAQVELPMTTEITVHREGQCIVLRLDKGSEYAAMGWVDGMREELNDPTTIGFALRISADVDQVTIAEDQEPLVAAALAAAAIKFL